MSGSSRGPRAGTIAPACSCRFTRSTTRFIRREPHRGQGRCPDRRSSGRARLVDAHDTKSERLRFGSRDVRDPGRSAIGESGRGGGGPCEAVPPLRCARDEGLSPNEKGGDRHAVWRQGCQFSRARCRSRMNSSARQTRDASGVRRFPRRYSGPGARKSGGVRSSLPSNRPIGPVRARPARTALRRPVQGSGPG